MIVVFAFSQHTKASLTLSVSIFNVVACFVSPSFVHDPVECWTCLPRALSGAVPSAPLARTPLARTPFACPLTQPKYGVESNVV